MSVLAEAPVARRALTLVDVTAIAINGIVGSGIFRLAGPLVLAAGGASVLGVLACGALCLLLSLCFAELGGMFEENGGPFLYAREAFGAVIGFLVGWLGLFNTVLGYAAVAAGFGDELAAVFPALSAPLIDGWPLAFKTLVSLLIILAPAAVNVVGVKAGARTMDVLTAAKLVPLLLLAGVGLAFVRVDALMDPGAGGPLVSRVASAAFMSVFLFSGFEFATVPAGEVKDAKRAVGVALVVSLVVCALLYAVLLWVTASVVGRAQLQGSPLAEAGVTLLGPGAARLLQAGAIVSMAGFCAGSALVAPRYFSAMAVAGHVPSALARSNRFGTPGAAILCSALVACALVLWLGFRSLVDLTNVTMLAQYIACAVAVLVLRSRRPDAPRRFRLPLGPVIPLAALGVCGLLLASAESLDGELRVTRVVLVVGYGVWGLTSLARRYAPG